MATQARKIVADAHTVLQDPAGVRWSAGELVGYLNDGQLQLSIARPDEVTQSFEFPLASGARQTLPATARLLVDVPRNVGGRQKALRATDRTYLEAIVPEWQSVAGTTEFVHFIYDMREPRVFFVYPPAKATGAAVVLTCAMYPATVATPSGPTAADVTGDIGVSDQWTSALLSYVLYRAFSKDAEYAANASLAASHLALFNAATGAQLQAAAAVAPKP